MPTSKIIPESVWDTLDEEDIDVGDQLSDILAEGTYRLIASSEAYGVVPTLVAGSIDQSDPEVGDTLTVSGGNARESALLQWQVGGVDVSEETDESLTTLSAGDYRLKITDGVRIAYTDAVTVSEAAVSAPGTFISPTHFSVTNGGDGTSVNIVIGALPSGDPFDSIEYRIDGGTAVALSAETTGSYEITGLTVDTEITIELRAENAGGFGDWSDTFTITPTVVTYNISGFSVDDTTDSFDLTIPEPGTLYICYHASGYTPLSDSGADLIAETDVNIIETLSIDTQELGEESTTLLYSIAVGLEGDTAGVSVVLDGDINGVSNVLTDTFTINTYAESVVKQTGGGTLNLAGPISANHANNLIAASWVVGETGTRQSLIGTGSDKILIGQWNAVGTEVRVRITGDNGQATTQNIGSLSLEDRVNLLVGTEVSGSDLLVTAYYKVNSGSWAQLFQETLVGAQAVDWSGVFAMFNEDGGGRAFAGGVANAAIWTELSSAVDVSSSSLQDDWARTDGTIHNPGLLRDDSALGIPKIQTFGGPSLYTDGENQGTAGDFNVTGDFVTYD